MTMIRPFPSTHEQVEGVPISNTFDGRLELSKQGHAMALLTLSHSPIEHQLYRMMFAETVAARRCVGVFGIRRLMALTGLRSYSSVRRGCVGLINKLSIEHASNDDPQQRVAYLVFSPEEIFARRRAAGITPYPREIQTCEGNAALILAVERAVSRRNLSRREAFVILCCTQGLTNIEIGAKLQISEQTVKFHLRRIFAKFGVRRRTELVTRLLTQSGLEPIMN